MSSRQVIRELSLWCCLLISAVLVGCSGDTGGNGTGAKSTSAAGNTGLKENDDGTYTVEVTDYKSPEEESWLADDQLADKHPEFFPDLVDRRPLGEWLINQSDAVIALDVPIVRPDSEPQLLALYPSYAEAVKARSSVPVGGDILPSVNMIDGKAKQFDDGLYAAIDQANYQGVDQTLRSLVDLVQEIQQAVTADHEASAFLAAGLQLAGREVPVADAALRDEWVSNFHANPVAAKPISFYTWSKTLEDTWRFMRFFQTPLGGMHTEIATEIARVLKENPKLFSDYQRAMELYSKLTNPYVCLTMLDIIDMENVDADRIVELCAERNLRRAGVALFPASTSREQMLFEKIFAAGLPANANLMRELVQRIRSGEVDLTPNSESGWYEHQVYALETLLLPEKGEEHDKLLLSKAYKKRMMEAFKALITKRRETHARQMDHPAPESMAPPPSSYSPRLRLEPAPSYYLRTARSYAFLNSILEATLGSDVLNSIHGLKKEGTREEVLAQELKTMRDLFYGLYLVSAEDIGLKPSLAVGEVAVPDDCYRAALDWLGRIQTDADLAEDTRVSIPIMVDPQRNATRLWLTLGVRLTKLDARYASPPSVRPADGSADWTKPQNYELETSSYLIAVDEFAEVELKGIVSLSREELREICDQAKTKEKIIAALQAR